jgi:hypothetical protein
MTVSWTASTALRSASTQATETGTPGCAHLRRYKRSHRSVAMSTAWPARPAALNGASFSACGPSGPVRA